MSYKPYRRRKEVAHIFEPRTNHLWDKLDHSRLPNTPEEYFALEAQSETRYEYLDGEVFAMADASASHNLIKGNLIAALRPSAHQRGCRVFDENMRLAVQDGVYYTYPDVFIGCDPADRRDPYLMRHPVLIAEILSPVTAKYDRTEKFGRYQQLPSLRHYLLVAQAA